MLSEVRTALKRVVKAAIRALATPLLATRSITIALGCGWLSPEASLISVLERTDCAYSPSRFP